MNDNQLIKRAKIAIQNGQKQQVRSLLHQALRQSPQNYVAWLWLASMAPTPEASLDYVQRAEILQPENTAVRKAKAWAEQQLVKAQPKQATSTTPQQSTITKHTWQSALLWSAVVILLVVLPLVSWLTWQGRRGSVETADSHPSQIGLVSDTQQVAINEIVATTAAATAMPQPTRSLVQAKVIGSPDDDPRPTWTVTPSPTNTPTPLPTPVPTFVSDSNRKLGQRPLGVGPNERWIDVDLSEQTLYAYEGNELIFETLISSGLPDHPTVTGQFRIWLRYESQTMDGRLLGYDYYLENVPYVMYFFEDYALHGTYWHNNFGTPMSHGCVNMRTEDAQWVFSWATGTVVNVHR